jgi:minor extracellular serine protease Vpr
MGKHWFRIALFTALLGACTADDTIDDPGDPGTDQGPAAGASDPAKRFTEVPPGSKVNYLPPSMISTDVVVMLELASDPVAVASSNAAVPFTAAQKQQHEQLLEQLQIPATIGAQALGAQVLGSYQVAYDGIKVKVPTAKVAALGQLPGVIAVHPVPLVFPENVHGVPLVGAPAVWDGVPGLRGEGIKIAVIDTGVDYTHADFGGPGTVDAWNAAHAAEASPPDPALFGPGAPKVKGGTDLVGDAYNGSTTPIPDANPIDCNGHGSHVSGTATGFGVSSDGTTYTGSYDATTINSRSWVIGPGVAPKADLYMVKVFGCTGGTNMTVDAIEWAVTNDMDVINMSLGSPYGLGTDPSATAASNAAKAGVIVVTSAGNSGTNPYLTGSPGTGNRVIATSAMDPTPSFPAANLTFSGGTTLTAIDGNGATFSDGTVLPVKVLMAGGQISLGCDPNEYNVPGVPGALVITRRGTCARVARAIFGQQAGAAAVLMVNNAASLPPFEGPITRNPDTGIQYTVTIPFLGVPSTALAAMQAADGQTVTLANATIANPTYLQSASFTSGGPRTGDSWLKPDVSAPGVAIISVAMGSGNGIAILSGTSMASPHNAGVAALVRQAHPTWNTEMIKAAIVNTADRTMIPNYVTRNAGSGLVRALPAVQTSAVATVADNGTATLNYGFLEAGADLVRTRTLKVRNKAATPVTFDITAEGGAGSPHSIAFSTTQITVPANGVVQFDVNLSLTAATAGDGAPFTDVAGLVTLTPTGGGNNGIALRVPYYMVPNAIAKVAATLPKNALDSTGTGISTVSNPNGATTGSAEFYAWGLLDAPETAVLSSNVKAVGAETLLGATPATDTVVFGLFTVGRWSNAAANEYDVYIDVNGDAVDDYAAVAYDQGLLTVGTANGVSAVAVFNLANGTRTIQLLADAPFDSRSMAIPVRVSQLCAAGFPCLSTTNPRLTYHVQAFGRDGTSDVVDGTASYNVYTPALSTGSFATVAPNTTATVTLSVDETELALTPARGFLVMSHENAGASEALLKPYVPAP